MALYLKQVNSIGPPEMPYTSYQYRRTNSSVLFHTLRPIVLPPADPLDSNPDGSLAKKKRDFAVKFFHLF